MKGKREKMYDFNSFNTDKKKLIWMEPIEKKN